VAMAPLTQLTSDDAAVMLLCEQLAQLPGGEACKSWTAAQARTLIDLVASHKGHTDDGDVCLMRDVKLAFKELGVSKIGAREKACALIQRFLWPAPPPKSEDTSLLAKEFLKCAQNGAVRDAKALLSSHPSVVQARSTSKGYTAMHYAAMAGSEPMLDFLVDHDVWPDIASTPSDGSPPLTPLQVAEEYKREGAAAHLKDLKEGVAFLKAAPAADDEGRLRAAARAGSAAAVRILLRRDPSLARKPSALAPNGALLSACTGGHVAVLRELMRCGAVDAVHEGPSPLQAAVAAGQADAANELHNYERSAEPLQLGGWTKLPAYVRGTADKTQLAPLNAMVIDAKLSRARSTVVECYDLQLASATGAPAMERSFLRWVEKELQLPVWLPVDTHLYLQLDAAVTAAVDALASAKQREALLPLTSEGGSKGDALARLSSVLPFTMVPSDLLALTKRGVSDYLGAELFESHWDRLTEPMRAWCARVIFFLPITPWGARKGEAGKDAQSSELVLIFCLFELLSKGRMMYHLFDDDAEAKQDGKPKRTHSVLPVQPQRPDTCPFEKKSDFDPNDARTYSAVLMLLAPVQPAWVRGLYPQCLMLNHEGIGGEFREKVANRLVLKLLLSDIPGICAPWVAVPMLYSEGMALAALAKLGGPQLVMLRHPHVTKFTAMGGGEIAIASSDLDEVLRALLASEIDTGRKGKGKKAEDRPVSKRIHALVESSRFWPADGGEQARGGILILESLCEGTPLPQDGKRGHFDPTQRAYCVRHRAPHGASTGRPPETSVVLSGCCRFPPQPLLFGPGNSVHSQRVPKMPHQSVPLGPEMARGAFESRLPIGAIFDAIESVSLKELVTWCLSSPQHPLLHLAGLSIMSGATAGAHKCHPDESMLEATRMEFLGRPIGANATVWPEHAELLMEFLEPSYASRYGAPMARLVQRRVLADVVVTDFHAIASNSKRKPDAKVCTRSYFLEPVPLARSHPRSCQHWIHANR